MEDLDLIWREYRADSVAAGSVVVDVGCSDGYFARWAEARGATVDAYDARHGRAVGPYDGTCTVHDAETDGGLGAYITPGEGTTPMISLASILARHPHVDFLKVDIEGGEYLIFDVVDLSNVDRIGMEFHAWTTPDRPVEGLGFQAEPMPAGAFDRLVAHLERTHHVDVVGPPEAGGYIHATRKGLS